MIFLYFLLGATIAIGTSAFCDWIIEIREENWYHVAYYAGTDGQPIYGHMPVRISGKLKKSSIDTMVSCIDKELDDKGVKHGPVVVLSITKVAK